MNNSFNIEFEVKDFLESDMKYFDRKARKIAYTVYDNPQLIGLLKEFLLSFIDNIDFDKRYKRWKKELPDFHLLYGQGVLEEFLQQLYDSYIVVKPYHLDKFRGLVFEYVMELHYKNLYNKDEDKFSCGCKVIINGNDVVYKCEEDESKSRKTIDIVGYNKSDSKFYELKVGPDGFDSHVIKYLNILNTEVRNNKVSDNITVGCITLKSKGSLKIKLKSNKVEFSELELNGFDEVEKMLIH